MHKLLPFIFLFFSVSIIAHAQNELPDLALNISTVAAQTGEVVCLDVVATDFDEIIGVTFSLSFDADLLQFLSIENLALPSATVRDNFNTLEAGEGKIGMLWTDLSNNTFEKPFTLFSVCFQVIGTERAVTPVTFKGDPTPIEVIGNTGSFNEDFFQGKFREGAVWIGESALPDIPLISGQNEIYSCNEEWLTSLDLTVSGGAPPYQYNWSGPEGFQSSDKNLPRLSFGVYSLTVTDQNQTPAFATFYLVEPQGFGSPTFIDEVELTPQTNCSSPNGAIKVNLKQDSASFLFLWSDGDRNQNRSRLAAGSYSLTVVNINDESCAAYWSGEVLDNASFDLLFNSECRLSDLAPDSVFATATPNGGTGPYTFDWSNGETTISEGASTMGAALPAALSVTVTDQEDCIVLSGLADLCPEAQGDNDLNASLFYECIPEQSGVLFTAYVWDGGAPPYTFVWSDGFSENSERSSVLSSDANGVTSVTITDADGLLQVLAGAPLPGDVCQAAGRSVQISTIDTLVEIDESFEIPIRLQTANPVETLIVALHWDPRRLRLEEIEAEHLLLGLPLDSLRRTGKADLTFENNQGLLSTDELALFRFTPIDTTTGTTPLLFGYSDWKAINAQNSFPITPQHGSVTLVADGTKVWPGDTDQSKITDHFDLLNIGLAHGSSGSLRSNASLDWLGQYSPAWNETTPQSAVDYRHIDTDGNGLVNDLDTAAISLNWGRATLHFTEPQIEREPEIKSVAVPLFVASDTILSGQSKALAIHLGTEEAIAENIYGLAFSIMYEEPLIGEGVWLDFSDSWLAENDSPLLTMYRNFPLENRIDVAMVRTDGATVSGSGLIARLILKGEVQSNMNQVAMVSIEKTKIIDADEQLIEATTTETPILVDFSSAITEPVWARTIRLSPIPASNELRILTEGLVIEGLQVMNMQGQTLRNYPPQSSIPVNTFASGTYLLRILTSKGAAVKQWVKR